MKQGKDRQMNPFFRILGWTTVLGILVFVGFWVVMHWVLILSILGMGALMVGSVAGNMFKSPAKKAREEWHEQWIRPINYGNGNVESHDDQIKRTGNYGIHGKNPFLD
jgi:hypothetical protein